MLLLVDLVVAVVAVGASQEKMELPMKVAQAALA
jgi:hypothetical protein